MAGETGKAAAGRRDRILKRDGHRCVYCGRTFLPSELTLDHVEPRVKGGDHSDGNLVTCCRGCNVEKGGRTAWEFLATRPVYRENFLRYGRSVWPRLRLAVLQATRS